MNVSTLGLMRVSASQRTIERSKTAHPLPNALVQVIEEDLSETWSLGSGLVVNGSKAENFHLAIAVRRDHDRRVPYFFVQQRAANRRGGGNLSRGDVRLLAGDQVVLPFLVLGVVVNLDRRPQSDLVPGNVIHVDH